MRLKGANFTHAVNFTYAVNFTFRGSPKQAKRALGQKTSLARTGTGAQILRGNHRLTSDGVVTYSERGNDDLHQKMKASGERILRKNRRSRPEAVVTYCEWERTTIFTKIRKPNYLLERTSASYFCTSLSHSAPSGVLHLLQYSSHTSPKGKVLNSSERASMLVKSALS